MPRVAIETRTIEQTRRHSTNLGIVAVRTGGAAVYSNVVQQARQSTKSAHELESASQAASRSKSFLTETNSPTQSSSSASSVLSRCSPLPADSSSQTSQAETQAISTWSSDATSLTSLPAAHAPHVIASFFSLLGALILSFLTRLHMCWRLVCPSHMQVERNFQKSAL